eukprot:CAMPEP_0116881910 /NCGR_PEP_ID=MMETSP0463-20121206/13993_1 /TAXON_ID=181622 /ORGANISM="Strombidinopsis sp, Strain SopsisLIS2011" /LENGTH=98 /DNA_ID=CAMNT_0004534269 /DNA_START=943 /DNA_END=1239 /DNA_ORIENTATION=-
MQKKNSIKGETGDDDQEEEAVDESDEDGESFDPFMMEDRTFFCSELVAKAYKVMGIMQNDVASSTFLPKNFTKKHDNCLGLKEGVSLGDEMFIYRTSD